MTLDQNFWLLFVANLPIVVVLFVAQQRRWIVFGTSHEETMQSKDKEIEFREKLRQEALNDIQALKAQNKENVEALRNLADVVNKSLEFNERLIDEGLDRGWDGNDRRTPKTSTRTR